MKHCMIRLAGMVVAILGLFVFAFFQIIGTAGRCPSMNAAVKGDVAASEVETSEATDEMAPEDSALILGSMMRMALNGIVTDIMTHLDLDQHDDKGALEFIARLAKDSSNECSPTGGIVVIVTHRGDCGSPYFALRSSLPRLALFYCRSHMCTLFHIRLGFRGVSRGCGVAFVAWPWHLHYTYW